MALIKFETVDALPDVPEPGVVYFVRRLDGELDTYVTSKTGTAVLQRAGHVQMHVESTPRTAVLPPAAEFGRYYATEALDLLELLSGVVSDAPATNESVIAVMLGATVLATATFAPAATEATIDVLEPVVPARSLLSFVTPALTDPTLAGVVGTFVARRT